MYWKSPFAALEAVGLIACGQRAACQGCARSQDRHGRCSGTLAQGAGTHSFILVQMRQLRLVAAPAAKLVGMCSAEEPATLLVDAGIPHQRAGGRIHGQSARAMVKVIEDSPCTRC